MNKGILKSPFHKAGITDSSNSNNTSTPATNLLAVVIPCEKYNVSPFPTLSELNEDLEGRFGSSSTNHDNLQSGPEVLSNPSFSASHSSNLSINNVVYLQGILEGPIEQHNISLLSHISELMAKIVNPSICNFFIKYQIQGVTRK